MLSSMNQVFIVVALMYFVSRLLEMFNVLRPLCSLVLLSRLLIFLMISNKNKIKNYYYFYYYHHRSPPTTTNTSFTNKICTSQSMPSVLFLQLPFQ